MSAGPVVWVVEEFVLTTNRRLVANLVTGRFLMRYRPAATHADHSIGPPTQSPHCPGTDATERCLGVEFFVCGTKFWGWCAQEQSGPGERADAAFAGELLEQQRAFDL